MLVSLSTGHPRLLRRAWVEVFAREDGKRSRTQGSQRRARRRAYRARKPGCGAR